MGPFLNIPALFLGFVPIFKGAKSERFYTFLKAAFHVFSPQIEVPFLFAPLDA